MQKPICEHDHDSGDFIKAWLMQFHWDLNLARSHMDIWLRFNSLASDYLDEMNRTPSFWQSTRDAHLGQVFMAVSRIIDSHPNGSSLQRLLNYIDHNPDAFELETTKQRQITRGVDPEMAGWHSLQLTPLKQLTKDCRRLLKEVKVTIKTVVRRRNQRWAHSDITLVCERANNPTTSLKQPATTDTDPQIIRGEFEKMLKNIELIVNKIQIQFDGLEHSYGVIGAANGVERVLKQLRSVKR